MQRIILLVLFAAMSAASVASIALASESSESSESSAAPEGTDAEGVKIAPAGTFSAGSAGARIYSCNSTGFTVTKYEYAVMQHVNAFRAKHNKAKFCVRAQLMRAARYWSNYMADNYVFSHGDFAGRMEYFYPNVDAACEDLAVDHPSPYWTPGELVDAWKASPSHRDCLLTGKLREMGFALRVNQAHDARFSTLDLGRVY